MAKTRDVDQQNDDFLREPQALATRVAREHLAGGGSTDDGIVLVTDLRDRFGFMVAKEIHLKLGLSPDDAEAKVSKSLDDAKAGRRSSLHAAWLDVEEADAMLTRNIARSGSAVERQWRSSLTQTTASGEEAFVYAAGQKLSFNVVSLE